MHKAKSQQVDELNAHKANKNVPFAGIEEHKIVESHEEEQGSDEGGPCKEAEKDQLKTNMAHMIM